MNDWFSEALAITPLMGILRGFSTERTLELVHTAWDAGITCVEIPIQSDAAVDTLAAVATEAASTDYTVGAGTVTTVDRVHQAVAAGAAFTVAPGVDEAVARASVDKGLPHLPGVATASDIQAAQRLGATWVKAFPASTLGTEWFSAMRGPFPDVHLVATGGIDAGNAEAYLGAGASAVALGSALEGATNLPRLIAHRASTRVADTTAEEM